MQTGIRGEGRVAGGSDSGGNGGRWRCRVRHMSMCLLMCLCVRVGLVFRARRGGVEANQLEARLCHGGTVEHSELHVCCVYHRLLQGVLQPSLRRVLLR
jgi:hypothetical protein